MDSSQNDCINTLNIAIQEFGAEGDSIYPPIIEPPAPLAPPAPPTQPELPPMPAPLFSFLPPKPAQPIFPGFQYSNLNIPAPVNPVFTQAPMKQPFQNPNKLPFQGLRVDEPIPKKPLTTVVEVSNTCLKSTSFRTYVIKTLNSLVSQLPDNTWFGSVKRYFGFTSKMNNLASKQLQKYTYVKQQLKGKINKLNDYLSVIDISTQTNKQDSCICYEILKYLDENKRKISAKDLILFLDTFVNTIVENKNQSDNLLSAMEGISVRYLKHFLFKYSTDLSQDSLERLNDIRGLSGELPISGEELVKSQLPKRFDDLAEGISFAGRHSRKSKGKHTSKRRPVGRTNSSSRKVRMK